MSEETKAIVVVQQAPRPSLWKEIEWTEERKELAKKAVTPQSATQAEFEFFIAWCQRTGLDPFIKQAYLIERYDSTTGSKRHEPMAAEAGMAALADAQPDFEGMKSGVVYAGDEFIVDEVEQTIVHRWSVEGRTKGGNKVIAAWAHARRTGRVMEISYVTFDSRAAKKKDGTLTQFWVRDPAGQLRKCARADQYRRCYPNLFSGVFVDAEFEREERDVTPGAVNVTPAVHESKVAELKARVAEQLARQDAAKAAKKTEPKVSPNVVTYGPNKGQEISSLSDADLSATIEVGEANLAKEPNAAWAHGVRACLEKLLAERAGRPETETRRESRTSPTSA